MGDFLAYRSRWRLALILISAVGLVALGMMLVGAFGEIPKLEETPRRRFPPELVPYVGWASILFFGACAIAVGKRFFYDKVQLSIGTSGIVSLQWSDQLIPWSEITEVSTWSSAGQKFIVLHLKNPDRFPGRGLAGKLARANRRLTRGDIAISLIGTDRSFDEAMSAIVRFRNAAIFN